LLDGVVAVVASATTERGSRDERAKVPSDTARLDSNMMAKNKTATNQPLGKLFP